MPEIPKNITNAKLQNLESSKDQETIYFDSLRKGFFIEIDPNGAIKFSYEYKFKKDIRKISLGTHPAVSLIKARDKWLESSKKVLDGKDIWIYQNIEEAKENNYIDENEENIFRPLSDKEIILFWKRIDSINQLSAITKLALKLILLTGIKKDDLLLATWEDININDRTWMLNSRREIRLNSLAIQMLLEIQDFEHHTAYSNSALKQAILDSNNKVINLGPKTLDRALNKKGCERLGINQFQPNSLAETFEKILDNNRNHSYSLDKSESVALYIRNLIR
ncbi:MAG TPA: DUF4102 domain-containing protein [Gammaproteobacteria bacterium]|jgi:integrase|nr:DUF4102 domain-containing protein [Gammaproteobacteria bacterium]HIK72700.1 DUF4102 domain-containing protein [Gammaproteobacteria bacterium]